MPTEPLTALELIDRGFARGSAVSRAIDLHAVEIEAVERAVDGPAAAGLVALDDAALVSTIREIATTFDPGHLGVFVDDLTVIASPEALADRMIAQKYELLGGAKGVLGHTAGAVSGCTDGNGWYRHFQHGSIFWHPQVGAHEVHGPIRDRWAAGGWERGPLGYPTSDELIGKDTAGVGRVSHFENGSLYWYPKPGLASGLVGAALEEKIGTKGVDLAQVTSMTTRNLSPVNVAVVSKPDPRLARRDQVRVDTPAVLPPVLKPPAGEVFEVRGAIRARYLALGGEASILGYPTSDEKATASGTGRFNSFQAGSIYWSGATGAHEVHGLIHSLWAASGFEKDPALGYPLTDELVPDRRVGSRRPESIRKPVLDLAADVVKLPSTAITGHISPSVVNLPTRVDIAALDPATVTGLRAAGLVTHVGGVLGGATTTADTPSPNRFGDFENGVAFWHRGAPSAIRLTPWRRSGGSGPTMPTTEVVDAVRARLKGPLTAVAGGLQSVALTGVSGYRHDGAGTHNRAHRLDVKLGGAAVVGVEAIVGFDPLTRAATLLLASWSARSGVDAGLERLLHQRLDPTLWTPTTLMDLASQGAVLSVKTMTSGDVNVYVEPATPLADVRADALHLVREPVLDRFHTVRPIPIR